MTELNCVCQRCRAKFAGDPEWDDYCPACERAFNAALDAEEVVEEDDGPCDCQSCRGYPDNFIR